MECDEAFGEDVFGKSSGGFQGDGDVVFGFCDVEDPGGAVDVAGDNVATYFVSDFKGALDVDRVTEPERAERGQLERLVHHIKRNATPCGLGVDAGGGQTNAVNGHAGAKLQTFDHLRRDLDSKSDETGFGVDTFHGSYGLDYSCKHSLTFFTSCLILSRICSTEISGSMSLTLSRISTVMVWP